MNNAYTFLQVSSLPNWMDRLTPPSVNGNVLYITRLPLQLGFQHHLQPQMSKLLMHCFPEISENEILNLLSWSGAKKLFSLCFHKTHVLRKSAVWKPCGYSIGLLKIQGPTWFVNPSSVTILEHIFTAYWD